MEVSEAVRSITDYFRLSMRYYYSNFHLFAKLCQQLVILVWEIGVAVQVDMVIQSYLRGNEIDYCKCFKKCRDLKLFEIKLDKSLFIVLRIELVLKAEN